jgi:hypothetical protein
MPLRPTSRPGRALAAVASIRVSIVALLFLLAVVLLCTFDQMKIGIHDAVNRDIRSVWIWATVPGAGFKVPVFPGGGLIGTVLLANFLANYITRFRLKGRHLALWLSHTGVVVLIVGEFASAFMAVETQMAIVEGETSNYTESTREVELVAVDVSDPAHDAVYSMPEKLLAKKGSYGAGAWPIELRVKDYMPNAKLSSVAAGQGAIASQGAGLTTRAERLAKSRGDDEQDHPAAYVEVVAGGTSVGTWLVSTLISRPQSVVADGREYRLELRPRRYYLPFSVTLKDFRREMYPGTEIPKSFSSLVRVVNPAKGDDRETLIYMNNPLRYAGLTFYQASFGQGDKLSVLQVVKNPSWLMPYIACTLAGLGMLVHFVMTFWSSRRVRA